MQFLGFGRSPSQQNTIGDGNCGPRALCDQLNLDTNDPDPDFGQDDYSFARRATVSFIKKEVAAKRLDSAFFEPSPAAYLATMAKNGIFVDNLFLQYFAKLVEKDIIIIPVHPKTTKPGDFPDFTWVKGGKDDQPSPSCPLFVGYFEDTHFLGPHYQSVVPLRQGVVLDTIVEHGGFNVPLHFGFAETSCSIASPGIEILKF